MEVDIPDKDAFIADHIEVGDFVPEDASIDEDYSMDEEDYNMMMEDYMELGEEDMEDDHEEDKHVVAYQKKQEELKDVKEEEDKKCEKDYATIMEMSGDVSKWIEKGNSLTAALMIKATKENHLELLKALIQAGGDVNLESVEGKSAIHQAVQSCSIEAMKMLLEAGADPSKKMGGEEDGRTPVNLCTCTGGNEDMVKLLIDAGADLDTPNNLLDGDTALIHAAKWEDTNKVFDLLIEAGADVNAKNKFGHTALYVVAHNFFNAQATTTQLDKIEKLVQKGCDLNARGADELYPLYVAVHYGQYSVVKRLLKHGADPNIIIDEISLLASAFHRGHYNIVKLLMCYGADIRGGAFSILELAITEKKENKEIVKFIIEDMGKGVEFVNRQGFTPLEMSAACGSVEMTKFLLSLGAKLTNRTLFGAVINNKIDNIVLLLEAGADVNVIDHGSTALMSVQSVEVGTMLIKAGANVDARTMKGKTPLMFAATDEIARTLIEAGADLDAVDWKENSALVYAGLKKHWTAAKLMLDISKCHTALECKRFLIAASSDN